jgi:hypothetical protein
VPNAASTYTTCQVIPNSRDRWVVLGLTATVGASASAFFFSGSSLADGSPLLPINCGAGQSFQSQLFNNATCPIILASVVGGSAVVWLKVAS